MKTAPLQPTPDDAASKRSVAPIIGISGKQYAGKDVLADLILKGFAEHGLTGWVKQPIAGAIKRAYAEQEGIAVEDVEANKAHHRSGLIALGNWGRAQSEDYWLQQALAQLDAPGINGLVISDVRLLHEANTLRQRGAFLIRLEARRDVRLERGTLTNETDATECELDHHAGWDLILKNNGTRPEFEERFAFLLAETHCFGYAKA